MQLLERVSISNLVDLFTKSGRRELFKALVGKSDLVEPTYEEVVVIWRPIIKQPKKISPPKLLIEFADMFDIEGFDRPGEGEKEVPQGKLEIRLFEQVPMSNLPAVLPKTKLVFRPADAFLFDMISFVTFALVVSSVRFDSTKLDLLALVSVTLWIFRTVFRYSNKLARYDLLVKNFLTSKISQRNAGAFKYLTYEAGSQRAIRAALVHSWLLRVFQMEKSRSVLTRSFLEQKCLSEINKSLKTDREFQFDASKAIQDLQDLHLVTFSEDGNLVVSVKDYSASSETVKDRWDDILDDIKPIYRPIDEAIHVVEEPNDSKMGQDEEGDPLENEIVVGDETINDETSRSSKTVDDGPGDREERERLRLERLRERRKIMSAALGKNAKIGLSKAKNFVRKTGQDFESFKTLVEEGSKDATKEWDNDE
jgi:hypothetical protein